MVTPVPHDVFDLVCLVAHCWLNTESADVEVTQNCGTMMLRCCFMKMLRDGGCSGGSAVRWLRAHIWQRCVAVICFYVICGAVACWWCGAVVWRLPTTSRCRQTRQKCELPPALQDCNNLETVARNLTFCPSVVYASVQGGFGSMSLRALILMLLALLLCRCRQVNWQLSSKKIKAAAFLKAKQ